MKRINNMRVVLDTNVLLVSVSRSSKYNWLYQALLDSKYEFLYTTEILLEYEEIISEKFSPQVANNVIRSIVESKTTFPITIYYNFNLIHTDTSDNKFVDCAFAGNANYLVTNDKHFNIVKKNKFPKINVINIVEFKQILFFEN